MDSARPRSLSIYRVRRHCVMDPAWIHDGSDVSDFTKPFVFIWILLGSTMDPTLHCPRNHLLSQGSCLDPRWFQDGLHAGIWAKPCFHKDPAWVHDGSDHALSTKPYVFKGILLGSTMVPGRFQRWELGETMCLIWGPAWIHEGSDFPHSTKPYVS